ncbi:hypothetical protein MJD09_17630 [bacterium]|nr:hypothetical protein [bacterium]
MREQISQKDSDKEAIAQTVISQPEWLPEIFKGLSADKANIKYGCDKVLRLVSEYEPSLLYPEIDFFIGNLTHENKFFKWSAIHILANLASVDSKGKIDACLSRYSEPIPGPVLITAANVIKGMAKIARAKPHLSGKLAKELLKVETATYQTRECRNIALGQVISAFGEFFDLLPDPDKSPSSS